VQTSQHQPQIILVWTKPNIVDSNAILTHFPQTITEVRISMCIRDDQGIFVFAKTKWLTPIYNVDLGEALRLLYAINWIYELQLKNVNSKLDFKNVVTKFYSNKDDMFELDDVIKDYKYCIVIFS
jgi:hypothetical protein